MSDNPAIAIAAEFIPKLVRATVANPDKLEIEVKCSEKYQSSTIIVSPSRDDTGNIIGKKGRACKAVQYIAKMVSSKFQWRISYFVLTPSALPGVPERPPLTAIGNFDSVEPLLRETLDAILLRQAEVQRLDAGNNAIFEVALDREEPVSEFNMIAVSRDGDIQHRTGDEGLSCALRTIFAAVGTMRGREVDVQVARPLFGDRHQEPQPLRADGKWAKEI